MAKATVYWFTTLDVNSGKKDESARPATAERIEKLGGTRIEGAAIEVDDSELDGEGFFDLVRADTEVGRLATEALGNALQAAARWKRQPLADGRAGTDEYPRRDRAFLALEAAAADFAHAVRGRRV